MQFNLIDFLLRFHHSCCTRPHTLFVSVFHSVFDVAFILTTFEPPALFSPFVGINTRSGKRPPDSLSLDADTGSGCYQAAPELEFLFSRLGLPVDFGTITRLLPTPRHET